MVLQRQDYLTDIQEKLILVEMWVTSNKKLKHQDSFIEIENFLRDLLNHVYGWLLYNANRNSQASQDAYDLADKEEKIAVQVSVDRSATKIRDTLRKFIGTHDADFHRLLFAYPMMEIGKIRADLTNELNGFDFEPKRDRIGFSNVLQLAQDMKIEEQSDLLAFLEREVRTLTRNRVGRREIAIASLAAGVGAVVWQVNRRRVLPAGEMKETLKAVRVAQATAASKVYDPKLTPSDVAADARAKIFFATFFGESDDVKAEQITDIALAQLLNTAEFKSSIDAFAEWPGPGGMSLDTWISNAEEFNVAADCAGSVRLRNARWWFVYLGTRRLLQKDRFNTAADEIRSEVKRSGGESALTYFAAAKRAILTLMDKSNDPIEELQVLVRTEFLETSSIGDDLLGTTYQRWLSNPEKYSQSEFENLVVGRVEEALKTVETDCRCWRTSEAG